MDFKEFEKLIPSLIPIILIIVVSWVFSFLAAKMRKQQQPANESQSTGRGENPLTALLNIGKGDDFFPSGQGGPNVRPGQQAPVDMADWRSYRDPQAPRITSDPIKPKWWGA